MPHSNFKARPIFLDAGTTKCPCGQTFNYESERELNMKLRLHKKSCNKWPGASFAKNPRKAITPKEFQKLEAERREFRE